MKQTTYIPVLFLLVGVALGYLLFSTPNNDTPQDAEMNIDSEKMEEMSGMDMSSGMHQHPMVEIDMSLPVPTLEIALTEDTKDGYNLEVMTENFEFAPEKVNQDVVAGEGHAHIYVNDVKLARLYGNWFNIPSSALAEGENTVMVTLNANDHSEWAMNGQHISALEVVDVAAE